VHGTLLRGSWLCAACARPITAGQAIKVTITPGGGRNRVAHDPSCSPRPRPRRAQVRGGPGETRRQKSEVIPQSQTRGCSSSKTQRASLRYGGRPGTPPFGGVLRECRASPGQPARCGQQVPRGRGSAAGRCSRLIMAAFSCRSAIPDSGQPASVKTAATNLPGTSLLTEHRALPR
jgi:hypothetical protein